MVVAAAAGGDVFVGGEDCFRPSTTIEESAPACQFVDVLELEVIVANRLGEWICKITAALVSVVSGDGIAVVDVKRPYGRKEDGGNCETGMATGTLTGTGVPDNEIGSVYVSWNGVGKPICLCKASTVIPSSVTAGILHPSDGQQSTVEAAAAAIALVVTGRTRNCATPATAAQRLFITERNTAAKLKEPSLMFSCRNGLSPAADTTAPQAVDAGRSCSCKTIVGGGITLLCQYCNGCRYRLERVSRVCSAPSKCERFGCTLTHAHGVNWKKTAK